MKLQVQREADCTKDYRLRRINPRAFVHKMAISNDRIIAVFQEVCFSPLFVWAAVNLLKAPAQHNTGVGRAQDFTLGFPGLGRGSGAASAPWRMLSGTGGAAWDAALRSTHPYILRMQARLEGCSSTFSDGTFQIAPLASVIFLYFHIPVWLLGLSPALFSVRASCCVFLGLLPEKQKENIF